MKKAKFTPIFILAIMLLTITGAFAEGEFTYTESFDGIKITEYNGTDTSVTIPAEYDGKTVYSVSLVQNTTIENFTVSEGVKKIDGIPQFAKTVKLPSTIETMYGYTLRYCSKLESIEIAEGGKFRVENGLVIGNDYTFVNMKEVEGDFVIYGLDQEEVIVPEGVIGLQGYCLGNAALRVALPESLKIIKEYAFAQTRAPEIAIPKNVILISDGAFEYAKGIEKITVSDENASYASSDGVLYNKALSELIYYPVKKADTSFTVPESVRKIASYAVKNDSLTKIELPDKLTEIGEYGLSECPNISEITLPMSWVYNFNSLPDKLVKIYGYADTDAQKYATDTGIEFVELPEPEVKTVTVSSSAGLLQELAPYTNIILRDGIYEVPSCITLHKYKNFSMTAENSGKAEILSMDGVRPVIDAFGCKNIALDGLILGHYSVEYQYGCGDTAYSSGYVVRVSGCDNVNINNCDLYGCGTVAAHITDTTNFVCTDSVLRDCKEYAVYSSGSQAKFTDCVVSGNAYDSSYASRYPAIRTYGDENSISFENTLFMNNKSSSFALSDDAVKTQNCTFHKNKWENLQPEYSGVCLNGITWKIDESTLYLGYDITLTDENGNETVTRTSAKGKVLPYSASSLPWKGLGYYYDNIVCAEGVEYDGLLFGTLGDNLSWSLNLITGNMQITGEGEMIEKSSYYAPWKEYGKSAKTLKIGEGITSVTEILSGLSYVEKLTLPESLEKVGDYGLCIGNFKELEIPKNVKYIGKRAVPDSIKKVTVYNNVKLGEGNPFSSSELEEIALVGEGNLRLEDGVLFDGTKLVAYPAKKSAEKYTVPEGTTSIGGEAFMYADVKEVILPEGVEAIGRGAFENSSIMWAELPESVAEVDIWAFDGCEMLISVKVLNDSTVFKGYTFGDCDIVTIYSGVNADAHTRAIEEKKAWRDISEYEKKGLEDFTGNYGDVSVSKMGYAFTQITNNTDSPIAMDVYSAVYDNEGRMTAIAKTAAVIPANDSKYVHFDIELPDDWRDFKIFAFNVNSVMPLCEAK